MKKILLSVILLLSVNFIFAQFDKKINASNEDIQNEKKSTNQKTWLNRAKLYQDIYDEPTKGIWAGMSQAEVNLILRDQKSIGTEIEKIGDMDYTVMVYPNKKLYFDQNGILYTWKVTKEIAPNPLQVAYEAYLKSIELDKKGGVGNKNIIEGLIRLSNQFKADGTNAFQMEDYTKALKEFQLSLECSSNPLVGQTDSLIIYFAGVAANIAKDNKTAEELFEKALKIGYTRDGDTYFMLSDVLYENGKKDKALEVLQTAMKSHPENKQILLKLIDFYLKEGDDPKKILPLIEQAKEAQPDNANLYYAQGNLYEKIAESTNEENYYEKASESYKMAIEKAPNYFFGYYGLAALYFNRGVNYFKEAENTPINQNEEYERKLKLADDEFLKALEPMLKAYELSPKEKSIVQSLKDIYFRFRKKAPEYEENYEKFNKILLEM